MGRNRYLGDHEGLNLAGMRDMGTDTKINHRSAAVYGGGGAIGDLGFNKIFLVFVVLIFIESTGQ